MRRTRRSSSVLAILAVASVVAGCGSGSSGTAGAGHSGTASSPSPSALISPTPLPTPEATPTPTPQPTVAIVPVADFRTTATTVDQAGVSAVLAGTSKQFTALELVTTEADGILAAIGAAGASAGANLILAPTLDALETDLDAGKSRLGLIPVSEVGPSIRAIAWGDKSLFGEGRVKSLADWPLQATLAGGSSAAAYDPSLAWTVAAAGDVNLDRGVYNVIHNLHKGPDYPFDGGSVAISSRYCCSPKPFVWPLPRTVRLSSAPLVRNLMSGADLAMVNLEGPAPNKSSYHTGGFTFTFNQTYLSGLKNAGIDVVSLANNHIGNAGKQGIGQTVAALDKIGIAHAGAGVNSKAARAPSIFTIQGVRVAFLSYDAIQPSYWTNGASAGSAQLTTAQTVTDIKAVKAAGAQVVIVYPHWGVEYTTTPATYERTWAHKMIDAGADLIIGNHVHYAAAMEVYKGKPIWYALGNFVFDQNWSEPTEEGLILELTFNGPSLAQAWMHPILDLADCQPNLLDAASATVVLNQVYKASAKLPSW
jgi:Bacterial capsule synthesis protein PGA_cap